MKRRQFWLTPSSQEQWTGGVHPSPMISDTKEERTKGGGLEHLQE